jgi:hypothetical protein
VSFVSKSDARLVADIEKLIKVKIELEAIEFEEDQPDIRKQGRINDGRRMYAEGAHEEPRRGGHRDGGARDTPQAAQYPRQDRAPRSSPARDPFFDKPYEPAAAVSETAPSWEASPARPGARSVSANIKPKRRVAALFKAE